MSVINLHITVFWHKYFSIIINEKFLSQKVCFFLKISISHNYFEKLKLWIIEVPNNWGSFCLSWVNKSKGKQPDLNIRELRMCGFEWPRVYWKSFFPKCDSWWTSRLLLVFSTNSHFEIFSVTKLPFLC